MIKSVQSMMLGSAFAVALLCGTAVPVLAQQPSIITEFVSKDHPPSFDTPEQVVDAFKAALAADDLDKLAVLLGLDAAKLKSAEGVMDTYKKIREGAAKKLVVRDVEGDKILDIGDELWPLPFPIGKEDDGKWSFDTYAGLEEIINRRIGENELEAIETMRAYVEAQEEYRTADHDGDGVFEYAQKLISTEGLTDGLYWPVEQGDGDSPAGDFADAAALEKAKAGEGYFGYKFRILTGQGENVAGGPYDYVINGNMIAGFGLVGWPVKYGETGVSTFVVNQNGIVYEADLGENTETIASQIKTFNPNDNWELAND
ncbi:DUF2950 domain-containing protein [Rhizobiaceae bacterium n13]|uniref:DUF2950 domain-containing protein n=1 Tax=Ferirhizobium litorale TaxID=2927786 RepID=A0AAE3QFM5_9HYPH|nr:DUF2950 domain-containing protein [Fererhizobium litorale]MDI7862088.1 DUF2950 domain-containing protein [Fererhizobium litorale]MDI7922640.1 DUF2950 domain-containing protein [Fererhizobium litorale]